MAISGQASRLGCLNGRTACKVRVVGADDRPTCHDPVLPADALSYPSTFALALPQAVDRGCTRTVKQADSLGAKGLVVVYAR